MQVQDVAGRREAGRPGRGDPSAVADSPPERGATTCRSGITRRPSGSGSWAG